MRLLKQGRTPTEVARMVGADNWSVTRWKRAFDKGGEAALVGKPHPGREDAPVGPPGEAGGVRTIK